MIYYILNNANFCMVDSKKLLCNVCEKKSALLIWDDRYSGFRGTCLVCGSNWPES